MASHQISIRQDVYEQLKKAKLPEESFSDTIQRLLKKESNIEEIIELYGAASIDDPEEEKILLETYEESRKELRENFSSRFNKRE